MTDRAGAGEEGRECLPVATTKKGPRGAAGMTMPGGAAPGGHADADTDWGVDFGCGNVGQSNYKQIDNKARRTRTWTVEKRIRVAI